MPRAPPPQMARLQALIATNANTASRFDTNEDASGVVIPGMALHRHNPRRLAPSLDLTPSGKEVV
jgi:hypothetical protein